jgi:hypothetical protein
MSYFIRKPVTPIQHERVILQIRWPQLKPINQSLSSGRFFKYGNDVARGQRCGT